MSTTPSSEAEAAPAATVEIVETVETVETVEEAAAAPEDARITKNGRDYVVLLSDEEAEELEGIEATLELLSDPEAQRRIEDAGQDIARGDILAEEIVRALVARQSRQTPG